jgi:YD repeat-containing protein
MPKTIKTIRKFSQHYRTFSFSEMQPNADQEFLESVIELDPSANVLVESKFDSEGELEEKNTFAYESHGKVIEHVLLYAVEDVTEKRVMKRDEKGRLLEEIKYYGDDSGERTTYVYDEKDNLIERKQYDEEGNFQTHEIFTYDENASLLEHKKLNKDNVIEEHRSFLHPDKLTIVENEFNPDGSLATKTLFKFDDEGKELTAVQTTSDGKLVSAVATIYDEKNNVIERQYKDFYSKTIRYRYDETNRCIADELYDGNGMLLRKKLVDYDEEGNVVAEQTYEMDTTRGGRDKHFGTRYEYEYYS